MKTTGGLHPVDYFEKPFPQFRLVQLRLQSLKSGATAHQHPIRNNELQADTHRCRGGRSVFTNHIFRLREQQQLVTAEIYLTRALNFEQL